MRRILVPGLAGLLLVGGCGATATATPHGSAATSAAPVAASRPPVSRPTARQIVESPRARLWGVSVHPGPDGLTVSAQWQLKAGGRLYDAITTSDDGFRSAADEPYTWQRWEQKAGTPGPPPPRRYDLMDLAYVTSLDPDIRAMAGGGDDTVFTRTARSVDGDAWQVIALSSIRGQLPAIMGAAVMPDGRILTLVDGWTGDRFGKHPHQSANYRGLMLSDSHWTHLAPYLPSFSPALPPPAPGDPTPLFGMVVTRDAGRLGPDGIIAVFTDLDRLYVSTDGAKTFHEIPARPAS